MDSRLKELSTKSKNTKTELGRESYGRPKLEALSAAMQLLETHKIAFPGLL